MLTTKAINKSPDVMGGTPVFNGTRVPGADLHRLH